MYSKFQASPELHSEPCFKTKQKIILKSQKFFLKENGRGGKEEEKATEEADRVSGAGILACLF